MLFRSGLGVSRNRGLERQVLSAKDDRAKSAREAETVVRARPRCLRLHLRDSYMADERLKGTKDNVEDKISIDDLMLGVAWPGSCHWRTLHCLNRPQIRPR